MERVGSAHWTGTLKNGTGELSTESEALDSVPYSAGSRFGGDRGTNPEELIGAAHAGCFSMALAMLMAERGMRPERIDTRAVVTLEKENGGYRIPRVRLETRVEAPGADEADFEAVAREAKAGCPVSKLLKADIELDATLIQ